MLKEFTGKLSYMKRIIVMHKYTFSIETSRLGLVPCKESFVRKIAIVNTVLFNSSLTLNDLIMVWSTLPAHIITLPSSYCLLLATDTTELDKIIPVNSGKSNVTQDSPVKITSEKSIFIYFLAQFWCFKIFALVKVVVKEIFYRFQFTRSSTTFVLLKSLNSSLFNDLNACRSALVYLHFKKASS